MAFTAKSLVGWRLLPEPYAASSHKFRLASGDVITAPVSHITGRCITTEGGSRYILGAMDPKVKDVLHVTGREAQFNSGDPLCTVSSAALLAASAIAYPDENRPMSPFHTSGGAGAGTGTAAGGASGMSGPPPLALPDSGAHPSREEAHGGHSCAQRPNGSTSKSAGPRHGDSDEVHWDSKLVESPPASPLAVRSPPGSVDRNSAPKGGQPASCSPSKDTGGSPASSPQTSPPREPSRLQEIVLEPKPSPPHQSSRVREFTLEPDLAGAEALPGGGDAAQQPRDAAPSVDAFRPPPLRLNRFQGPTATDRGLSNSPRRSHGSPFRLRAFDSTPESNPRMYSTPPPRASQYLPSGSPRRRSPDRASPCGRRVRLGGSGMLPTDDGLLRLELAKLGRSSFTRVFDIESSLHSPSVHTPNLRPPSGHIPGSPARLGRIEPSRFFAPSASASTTPKSLACRVLDKLCLPHSWIPPEPFSPAPFSALDMRELCKQAYSVVTADPMLLRLRAPAKIFGDIHGQFDDLLSYFAVHGTPYPPIASDLPGFFYIFNGDFVDRGPFSLEVVCFLFALKIHAPKQVFMIRGNHESIEVNKMYGFYEECLKRFPRGQGERVYEFVNKVFHQLPVAAVLDNRILVLHGGIGPSIETLQDIAELPRGTSISEAGEAMSQALWSDPAATDADKGYIDNTMRGAGVIYGADMVRAFRERNKLDMIVRSHEPVQTGFEWFDGGHLITVFSATNYTGTRRNFGAFLLVDNTLKVEPRLIPPEFDRLGFSSRHHVAQQRPPTPERVRPSEKPVPAFGMRA